MGLRRVKNVLSSFVKGNYQFGRTFTSRFSDSRWSGVVDALAGVGITAMSVQWLVGNVVTAGVAAMSIASAPITAPITIATSAVFAVLSGMMVGFGVGFLGAALVKSGLPRPSTMVRQVKAAVVDGTAAGVELVKKPFVKLSALFKKAAGKGPGPSGGAAPKFGKRYTF